MTPDFSQIARLTIALTGLVGTGALLVAEPAHFDVLLPIATGLWGGIFSFYLGNQIGQAQGKAAAVQDPPPRG